MPFQFRKEAIEEDLNSNFPSQGQGNPPLYYSLSEVVVPTYSINTVAEGSSLPENLQTAWDFSTGSVSVSSATSTVISNTGFWLVDFNIGCFNTGTSQVSLIITDGASNKLIFRLNTDTSSEYALSDRTVVFLRSGDSLTTTANANSIIDIAYRQIASVNGTLVNPLGYSAA
jgi:hypothetical protein|tara:strand:+ start:141 stop:656 length:516 start_codon:yes stop_codon:yes gene_type:complete